MHVHDVTRSQAKHNMHRYRGRPAASLTSLIPLIDIAVMAALTAYFSWLLILLAESRLADDLSMILLFFTGVINIYGLLLSLKKNSLPYTSIFFFNVLFFSLAPSDQFRQQFDPIYADAQISRLALSLVLAWSMLCAVFLFVLPRSLEPEQRRPERGSPAVLWLASVAASVFGIFIFGARLFSSRDEAYSIINQSFDFSIGLVLTGMVFPFAFYGALVGLWLSWKTKLQYWRSFFVVAMLLALLLNNFTILSRYQFATLLVCAIFFWIGPTPWNARALFFALLAGAITSPLFNVFRSAYSPVGSIDQGTFLSSMDYDAFSLLCHTIFHIDRAGISWGANLLSAALFFVPRSIWPDKLQITPYYLMDSIGAYRGLWNHNLSEPLIAEGYFAFGIAGAFLIAVSFLWGVNRLETAKAGWLSAANLFRCALPIIVLMVLRGSLIVGMSIIVGHLVAIWVSVRLADHGKMSCRLR